MDAITHIPTAKTMKTKRGINKYVNLIKRTELQGYVSNNPEYANSDIIHRILNKEIDMSHFIFKQEDVLKLLDKILETSEDAYTINGVQDLVLLMMGVSSYEDDYEKDVIQEISDRGISVDTDDILRIMSNIRDIYQQGVYNPIIETLILNRISSCTEDPSQGVGGFFQTSISFPSTETCKSQKEGLLYLTNEYKMFLTLKINVQGRVLTKLELIMILIYWDIRINELSRYISLELIRKKEQLWEIDVDTLLQDIYEYEIQVPLMVQEKKQVIIDKELQSKQLQEQEMETQFSNEVDQELKQKITSLTEQLKQLKTQDPKKVEKRHLSQREIIEWDLFKKEQEQKQMKGGGSLKSSICKKYKGISDQISVEDLYMIDSCEDNFT